jgi:hypothetical protein
MPGPFSKIRHLARSEPLVALGVGSLVLTIAAWVTPQAIEAMQPDPPPLGEVLVEGVTPDERSAVVEGLRTLLESSYAYVCSRDAGDSGSASITLWQSDDQHRGSLDAGEALVLTHSALLEKISAAYVEGAPAEQAVAPADLCAADATRRLRGYGTVRTRVIATGVRAFSVAPRREEAGTVELTLGLTWSAAEVEAEDDAGPSRTLLRVRLRLVEGLGR